MRVLRAWKCPRGRIVVDMYHLSTIPTYRRNQFVLELVRRTVDGQWCTDDQEDIRRWVCVFVDHRRFCLAQRIVNVVVEDNVGSQISNVDVRPPSHSPTTIASIAISFSLQELAAIERSGRLPSPNLAGLKTALWIQNSLKDSTEHQSGGGGLAGRLWA